MDDLRDPTGKKSGKEKKVGVQEKPKLTRMKVIFFEDDKDSNWQSRPCQIINLHRYLTCIQSLITNLSKLCFNNAHVFIYM